MDTLKSDRLEEIAEFVLELPQRRKFTDDKELLATAHEYLKELVADEIIAAAARKAAEAKEAELLAEKKAAEDATVQPLQVESAGLSDIAPAVSPASAPESMLSRLSVDTGKPAFLESEPDAKF